MAKKINKNVRRLKKSKNKKSDYVAPAATQQKKKSGGKKPHAWLDRSEQGERTVIGQISLHRDGYGFVLPEEPGMADVFIPPGKLMGALHLDRVEVTARMDRRGRYDGRVVKVLKRGMTQVVGEFKYYGEDSYVEAKTQGTALTILIPKKARLKAKAGQMVVAKIVDYAPNLTGEITELLGEPGDHQVELNVTAAKFGLNQSFDDKIVAEAKMLEKMGVVTDSERVDLRNIDLVTIDGETARDFDDAICVKKQGNKYRLWVSIADVSHYVTPGSALDQEAYQRGTSVYFPDYCIPMLPEQLSNGLCSLVPNEDRLSFTVEMVLSAKGEVLESHSYKSIMCSKARLTYTWVNQAILQEDQQQQLLHPHVVGMLKDAVTLAKILRGKRKERGSIDFDLPEPYFVLGKSNETLNIIKAERNFAHMMIEEFMVLTNEVVASWAESRSLPFVYRVHAEPDADKSFDLIKLLHNLGFTYKMPAEPAPGDYAKITDLVKGSPVEALVNHVLLRTMKQAVYSATNAGHFGLASTSYSHFTSPIRRYPDLVIHGLLALYLRGKPKQMPDLKKLQVTATHCSRRERIAMEAEWEVQALRIAEFMLDKVGNEYSGHVCRVAKFGLFVELSDFFVEGLVHVDGMTDDHYQFDSIHHQLIGKRHKRILKIGDPLKIRVMDVSLGDRKVFFQIIATDDKP